MKKEQNSSEQKIDQGDVMPLASHEELLDIDRSSDEKKKNQSNTNDSAPRISQQLFTTLVRTSRVDATLKASLRLGSRIQRKEQNLLIYFITLFCTAITGTENLYVFLWGYQGRDKYIFFPTLVFRPIFFLACSWHLSRNFQVLAKLYFCFDRIFLAGMASTLSVMIFSYFFIPLTPNPWIYYSMFLLVPLLNFSFSGYCRTMMVYCQWSAWQTILFKLAVILGGVAYFGVGIYYTIVDGQFTDGASPRLDNIILQLLFLYAFSGFDYHIEIVSLIDDADGTNQNKSDYKLRLEREDIDILQYGRTLNKQNTIGGKKSLV